jgi:mRNA interferase MazF
VRELAIIVPATATDRGWPHHVPLEGPSLDLPRRTYAMTDQPRTISRRRIFDTAGRVDEPCLSGIRRWLNDFLNDPLEGNDGE